MKRFIETIKNIWKIDELREKILLTLGLLLIYRLGSNVVLPGIDPESLGNLQAQAEGGPLGLLNAFTGGAFNNAAVLALGIMPYISASIVIQLMSIAVPYFQRLQKEGEDGRRKINQITRLLTIAITAVQAYGYLINIKNTAGNGKALLFMNSPEVMSVGMFMFINVLLLTAGTMFTMWLGEKITDKGLGNGISLIIMIGIIAGLPQSLMNEFFFKLEGGKLIFFVVEMAIWLAVILSVVLLVQGTRRIPVNYAKQMTGSNMYGGARQYIPLKVNAAGVMQVPMLISIWDDEYGISVHAKHQTTKQNLSSILSGFKTDKFGTGIELITVNGWDYPSLMNAYKKASEVCRKKHTPVVVHVKELTQPQGHSTSGSHERYKSKDRLAWEIEYDCVTKMKSWMLESKITTEDELEALEKEASNEVKEAKKAAWTAFTSEIKNEISEACTILETLDVDAASSLKSTMDPGRKDILKTFHKVLRANIGNPNAQEAKEYYTNYLAKYQDVYSSHLHSQSSNSALSIAEVKPEYSSDSETLNGFEILNKTFDNLLTNHPEVIAFGEDVGKIGDVNQGFAGLQDKHGDTRVMDMGIRENTIVGQAIGASLRGLRPIAEIQYLDYLLYGVQMMSDDIATVQYRTKGGQKYPLIIRTRGHRLEGIWHSGSPMGMILNAVRGMNVLVPRDMTRAAGFYNTIMKSDEPAIVVECLNGYRLKEKLPNNLAEFTVPVGVPETLIEGSDVTVITYGSCVRIAQEGIALLEEKGISVELIDVQSLLPFDINHDIVESLKKTNKVVFMDEDVKGGATGFIMQKVLEEQGGYQHLDSAPRTLTSQDHRPAYGTDGDYFSKSNAEELFDLVYDMMNENNPEEYPNF